jgi:hypothetical protein
MIVAPAAPNRAAAAMASDLRIARTDRLVVLAMLFDLLMMDSVFNTSPAPVGREASGDSYVADLAEDAGSAKPQAEFSREPGFEISPDLVRFLRPDHGIEPQLGTFPASQLDWTHSRPRPI